MTAVLICTYVHKYTLCFAWLGVLCMQDDHGKVPLRLARLINQVDRSSHLTSLRMQYTYSAGRQLTDLSAQNCTGANNTTK